MWGENNSVMWAYNIIETWVVLKGWAKLCRPVWLGHFLPVKSVVRCGGGLSAPVGLQCVLMGLFELGDSKVLSMWFGSCASAAVDFFEQVQHRVRESVSIRTQRWATSSVNWAGTLWWCHSSIIYKLAAMLWIPFKLLLPNMESRSDWWIGAKQQSF